LITEDEFTTQAVTMPPDSAHDPAKAPDCWQCRNFAISWDPRNPYHCKMMGFKSRMIPSFEVFRADGSHCRGFMPKAVVAEKTVAAPPPPVRKASRYLWKA
jgi:hypothetical protein